MNPGKNWLIKCVRFLLLLIPALGLAMPASAQVRDTRLSDSQEPGSVIVFPKFIKGTVTVDKVATPNTEIEVGAVCPAGVTCPEHQSIKIRFHWVCGSSEASQATSFVCKETDFDVTLSVFEKVVITPNGSFSGISTRTVPGAECDRGYLVGWVINPANDQPIKFDGLIGDAVLRESGTAVSEYGAIPIQAEPRLANGAPIATVRDPLTGTQSLVFDGVDGHYQAVTGRIRGDVKFIKDTPPAPFSETFLTLLTLDVRSNQPNYPTFVGLDFWGTVGTNPEFLVSTSTEFICWAEVQLDDIDANLVQGVLGRKGVFDSTTAFKVPLNGIFDRAGPVTLLGLVETNEGPTLDSTARSYISPVYNDSVPVATIFVPF